MTSFEPLGERAMEKEKKNSRQSKEGEERACAPAGRIHP